MSEPCGVNSNSSYVLTLMQIFLVDNNQLEADLEAIEEACKDEEVALGVVTSAVEVAKGKLLIYARDVCVSLCCRVTGANCGTLREKEKRKSGIGNQTGNAKKRSENYI